MVFILTTVILFLMANHLFKGSNIREVISILDTDLGQVLSHSKEIRHIVTANTSSKEYIGQGAVDQKQLHDSNGSNGSVTDRLRSYVGPRNDTCRDALCTNYLSSSDMTSLFQCQRNATKKVRHFMQKGRAAGNVGNPLLSSLHRDYSTGALSSGKCQFMEGKGKKAGIVQLSLPSSPFSLNRGF